MYRIRAVTPPSLNVEKLHYRWLLVKLLWQHIVAVSSAYFVTLLLYPGISTLVQDCSLDDWTPIILVLLFGITDLLGKVWCAVMCGVVWCGVMCCAVWWCGVVCCAVWWCAVLCGGVVCCAVLCGSVPCCVVVWCGVVCCAVWV